MFLPGLCVFRLLLSLYNFAFLQQEDRKHEEQEEAERLQREAEAAEALDEAPSAEEELWATNVVVVEVSSGKTSPEVVIMWENLKSPSGDLGMLGKRKE